MESKCPMLARDPLPSKMISTNMPMDRLGRNQTWTPGPAQTNGSNSLVGHVQVLTQQIDDLQAGLPVFTQESE